MIARLPELQRALRKGRPFSCRVTCLDSMRKVRRALRPAGLMVAVIGTGGQLHNLAVVTTAEGIEREVAAVEAAILLQLAERARRQLSRPLPQHG